MLFYASFTSLSINVWPLFNQFSVRQACRPILVENLHKTPPYTSPEKCRLQTTNHPRQERLVASLRVENQALQAALERLRLDFQEERGLREKEALQAAAKKGRGSRGLGILGRRKTGSAAEV